tara:strand:+ start:138 stop:476 length:339 start_codon:yes stop_codon:yes gene_type:complete
MTYDLMFTLSLLIFAHALADYPLQGDFLSKAKNHKSPIPGVPWWQALAAHSVIHAGAVLLITGSFFLMLAELAIHALTDFAKCSGWIGYNTDQAIHIGCKVLWVAVIWWAST